MPVSIMNRKFLNTDDSWENDAVWKLLDQSPPAIAGPRFVTNTVRAARLMAQTIPWWQRCLSPRPLAGLAAATAAVVFSVLSWLGPAPESGTETAMLDSQQAAKIQDIAETETLITAVDQLDDFSDTELVSLIGF
jgi:hypothetical protein